MGFFSFKCAKSKLSIPAFPYAKLPEQASHVVLVLPDNKKVKGIYDGYGKIDGIDLYDEMARIIFGTADRELIWNGINRVYSGKKLIATIQKGMWDEPLKAENIISSTQPDLIIGVTMNDLKAAKFKLESDFDRAENMVKMVRMDHYNGETYDELPVSKNCRAQGYFYERAEARKIFLSVIQTEKKGS
jgi:hypothetical protein